MTTRPGGDARPLKAPEVAARLGISRSAVYRLAAEGKLPSLRITERAVAFDPEDVEEFLRRCRRGDFDAPTTAKATAPAKGGRPKARVKNYMAGER